jgi:hypothetical protein
MNIFADFRPFRTSRAHKANLIIRPAFPNARARINSRHLFIPVIGNPRRIAREYAPAFTPVSSPPVGSGELFFLPPSLARPSPAPEAPQHRCPRVPGPRQPHPCVEGANEPTSQPASQPASQPDSQPDSQPTSQPTSQPANKPTSQPANQPASERRSRGKGDDFLLSLAPLSNARRLGSFPPRCASQPLISRGSSRAEPCRGLVRKEEDGNFIY